MIKRFGSSERKSKFENANKGLTRLAGRQTDFLDKEWGHGFGFKHATKENKRKMALLALNSVSFQVKKTRDLFFKSSFGSEGPERASSSFGNGFGFGKTRCKGARTKSFANNLKRPIEFNGRIFKQNKNFYNKRIAKENVFTGAKESVSQISSERKGVK